MKSLSLPGMLLLCALLACAPLSVPSTAQAAALSVYDKQPDVTEKELLQFLDLLPQFRQWTRTEKEEELPALLDKGMQQIVDNQYDARFRANPEIRTIHHWSVAFCRKSCLARARLSLER